MNKKNNAAVTLGRLGGKAVVKKKGKKYMQRIGLAGSVARWGNKNNKIKK